MKWVGACFRHQPIPVSSTFLNNKLSAFTPSISLSGMPALTSLDLSNNPMTAIEPFGMMNPLLNNMYVMARDQLDFYSKQSTS
jgi:hypothetical protein